MATTEAAPQLAPAICPESALGAGAVHPVLAELAAVRAALTRVGACSGWSMTDAEVTVALEQLLAARAQLEAVTATQVAAAEARGLRAELNQSSTARWLRRRFRVSGGEAGRLQTLAGGLGRWQGTAAVLAAGQVGTEQAAAITGVLDALPATTSPGQRGQAEVLLLDQATTLDPGELAACGRVLIERLTTVPDVDDPAEEARLLAEEERAARDQHARRELTVRPRRDGMIGITGLLEPFTGALVRAALAARAARTAEADGLRDERSKGQRMADALTELATTAGAPARPAAGPGAPRRKPPHRTPHRTPRSRHLNQHRAPPHPGATPPTTPTRRPASTSLTAKGPTPVCPRTPARPAKPTAPPAVGPGARRWAPRGARAQVARGPRAAGSA